MMGVAQYTKWVSVIPFLGQLWWEWNSFFSRENDFKTVDVGHFTYSEEDKWSGMGLGEERTEEAFEWMKRSRDVSKQLRRQFSGGSCWWGGNKWGERGGGRVQLRLHCFLLIFPTSRSKSSSNNSSSWQRRRREFIITSADSTELSDFIVIRFCSHELQTKFCLVGVATLWLRLRYAKRGFLSKQSW